MPQHLEVAAIGQAAEHHALPEDIGPPHLVAEPVANRPSADIVHRRSLVAAVEVPAAIGADRHGMDAVIVLQHARLREQRLLAVGLQVAVIVMEHPHVR